MHHMDDDYYYEMVALYGFERHGRAPPTLINSRRSWASPLDSLFLTRTSRSGRFPLLEIEIGEIHVAVGENVNGEHMLSLRQ